MANRDLTRHLLLYLLQFHVFLTDKRLTLVDISRLSATQIKSLCLPDSDESFTA